MNTQTKSAQRKLLFENTTCTRCGGGGRMPFSVYGGVCFKCYGRGATLTKRGRAAQNWLQDQRVKPLEDFQAGDWILAEGFSAGSYSMPSRWAQVESVEHLTGAEAGHVSSPDLKCVHVHAVFKDGKKYTQGGFLGESKARFAMTPEQQADLRQHALAYQATLTKSGTVAKRPAKSAAALGAGESSLANPPKIALAMSTEVR
jgi:hypothetical protein